MRLNIFRYTKRECKLWSFEKVHKREIKSIRCFFPIINIPLFFIIDKKNTRAFKLLITRTRNYLI